MKESERKRQRESERDIERKKERGRVIERKMINIDLIK